MMDRAFLPAAGHDFFLPLYDPLTRLAGVDKVRQALIDQAELAPGQRVLDVGCGTGTLLVFVKQRHPNVDAVGVDPDPKALARARRKSQRAGVDVEWDRGFADELTYADASFDRVFSSLMFHHIERDDQANVLRELRRVLRPGGRLELVDMGPTAHRHGNRMHQWFHSHERMHGNSAERVVALLTEAGFARPRVASRRKMLLLGSVYFYQAHAPLA